MPRANLRLGLRGWHTKDQPRNLILYRLPWRKSWVQTIRGESDATPLLSRSGLVHVLIQKGRNQILSGPNLKRQQYWPSGRITLTLVAGLFSFVIGLMMLGGNPAASKDVMGSNVAAAQDTELECKKYLGAPNLLISKNLDITNVQGLQASFSNELIYGGVRSRKVDLTCDDNSVAYRLVEILIDNTWQLNKFAPTR